MANAILNFHFDFLNPSLMIINWIRRVREVFQNDVNVDVNDDSDIKDEDKDDKDQSINILVVRC